MFNLDKEYIIFNLEKGYLGVFLVWLCLIVSNYYASFYFLELGNGKFYNYLAPIIISYLAFSAFLMLFGEIKKNRENLEKDIMFHQE